MLVNTKKEFFTLDEYREKIKPAQTDKDESVVYLYTTDPDKQDAFIQSAEARGYDVLLMNSPLDNHFISQLEHKLEKTQVKRVDSGTIDTLIKKDDTIPSILTEEQTTAVKSAFEKTIQKPGMTVSVESLSPNEMPVTVTMDEFMRRMKDMAQMGGGMSFYGAMPDNYKVTVNSNHPLINRMAQAGTDEEKEKIAKQAYDLALLSQGMLSGAELTDFVKRSVEMI